MEWPGASPVEELHRDGLTFKNESVIDNSLFQKSVEVGNWSVMFSRRREKSVTFRSVKCAWILSPSYLYSAAALPFIFSRISLGSESLSASIGLIGLPTVTWNDLIALIPPVARAFATNPRSEERL